YHPEISSAPGSVSQVRESTQSLMNIAKQMNIATFIVGHVTKEGQIAGPRLLEHMVDTVLYFEGDEHHAYRILRAVKNRFGSTNEMGIFEMKQSGLKGVHNPSEMFLEERSTNVPGSTIVATMEGTRPLLIEVQALVTPTTFNNPRRMATGIDHNRLSLLMAVLEKKENYLLQQQDAYIKVAGGVRLTEPAVDLSVIVATASSFKDKAVDGLDCYIGEVGLTGEVRRVSRIEQRVQEAAKLGFERVIIPQTNIGGWQFPEGIKVVGVSTVHDALKYAFKS
ncbi:MAG: DNA repair protein RadA, partial [Staphylococcus sp.]|nr:DNA repair protein RadA [Staphylococcus sp.]